MEKGKKGVSYLSNFVFDFDLDCSALLLRQLTRSLLPKVARSCDLVFLCRQRASLAMAELNRSTLA